MLSSGLVDTCSGESMANRKPASISTRKKTFFVVSLNWMPVSEIRCRNDAAAENVGCATGGDSR